MPELPEVTQGFEADVTEYIAAMEALIEKTEAAATAVAEFSAILAELGLSGRAAATGLGEAASSAGDLRTALEGLAGVTAPVDAALGGLDGKLDDLIMLGSATVSELHDIRDAMAGVAVAALAMAAATKTAADAEAGAAAQGTVAATRWAGIWNLSGNAIHWIVMGTLEIAATAIPAMIALGAAVVAMEQPFAHINDRMTELYYASGSLTGALVNSVGPLSAMAEAGYKLQQAVAPDAYIIFGAVINALTGHVGTFSSVAQQASNVLAQFATKISSELSGPAGQQIAGFFADAVKYMIQWGQVLGNLGHTFINIVAGMHGVGQILLDVLVGISHALELITANHFVAWVIGALAAMSAMYRYGLLLRSIFNWLGGSALVSGFKSLAAVATDVGYAFMAAGGGMAGFKEGLLTLGADIGPVALAIAAAAAALLLWKYVASGSQDPTDRLIASLNKMPPTMANLNDGIQKMAANIASLYPQIGAASAEFDKLSAGSGRLAAGIKGAGAALSNMAANDIAKSITEMTKLTTEAVNLATGLAEAGQRAGAVGADMDAMAIQTAIADSNIQKVNQALDQYISILTGATSGNANFITSLANIGTVAATTANNLGTASSISLSAKQFSQALGAWGTTGAAAWQNFDQVVNGSIEPLMDNLRMMGVTGALTGKQVSQAMIDMVVSTAKWAGNNPAAQATLMSLLNTVGIAPSDFSKFVASQLKAGAGQRQLNGIVNSGTIAFSKLSQMAKNAAQAIDPVVTQALTSAALKASGYDTAVAKLNRDIADHQPRAVILTDLNNIGVTSVKAQGIAASYGNTVSSSQQQASSATHTAATKMGTDMDNSKGKMQQLEHQAQLTSSNSVSAMSKLGSGIRGAMNTADSAFNTAIGRAQAYQRELDSLHSPPPIVVTTIYQTVGSPIGSSAAGFGIPPHRAAGGPIYGPGTKTSDSVPIMASHGEFMMNAASVDHYGKPFFEALNARRLASGGPTAGAGGSGMALHGALGHGGTTHVNQTLMTTVKLRDQVLGTAIRRNSLIYDRRNSGNNLALRYR